MQDDGVAQIAAERDRQRNRWSASHDAGHARGELALAAACYAMPESHRRLRIINRDLYELLWPRDWDYRPHPTDRIRELTKAGALIAAEIDRLLQPVISA